MGLSEFDPAARERISWNAGRKVGAKRALKPRQIWATRFQQSRHSRAIQPCRRILIALTVPTAPAAMGENYQPRRAFGHIQKRREAVPAKGYILSGRKLMCHGQSPKGQVSGAPMGLSVPSGLTADVCSNQTSASNSSAITASK